MTREEAKELLPIIKAFAEGKTIQFYEGNHKWRDVSLPDFQSNPKCYRIKPEPKYRPFRTQEECWEEMHKHPDFGWVFEKEECCYINLAKIEKKRINGWQFDTLYGRILFTDGKPFGIKEE